MGGGIDDLSDLETCDSCHGGVIETCDRCLLLEEMWQDDQEYEEQQSRSGPQ
jgi:hypothetical protein